MKEKLRKGITEFYKWKSLGHQPDLLWGEVITSPIFLQKNYANTPSQYFGSQLLSPIECLVSLRCAKTEQAENLIS
jgi:hypothetical protein